MAALLDLKASVEAQSVALDALAVKVEGLKAQVADPAVVDAIAAALAVNDGKISAMANA